MERRRSPAHLRRRARAWGHVVQSALMARIDPDWVPRPRAGHFMVTFRCNLRCAGCGSWEVDDHDDLSAEEWAAVFRQLPGMDIVKILGGEPLVRPDIVEILAAAREHCDPYMLQLTTNGMLRQRLVEAIHAVGWPGLQLRVSLDGTERTHDRMRGVQGSWRQVVRTLREVAELQGRYGFRVGVNFALTDESIHELDEMVRFCEDLGVDLVPGVNLEPFLVGTVPPEVRRQRVIMISDLDAALRALEDARVGTRRQLPLVDHLLGRWTTRRTFRQQLEEGAYRFPCRELRDLMYVLPNGDVVRCGLDHAPLGNLRRQSVDEVWFGPEAEAARRRVDACPGCLQASIQIMSRIYAGRPFARPAGAPAPAPRGEEGRRAAAG